MAKVIPSWVTEFSDFVAAKGGVKKAIKFLALSAVVNAILAMWKFVLGGILMIFKFIGNTAGTIGGDFSVTLAGFGSVIIGTVSTFSASLETLLDPLGVWAPLAATLVYGLIFMVLFAALRWLVRYVTGVDLLEVVP